MKKLVQFFFLCSLLILSAGSVAAADINSSGAKGLWSQTATWVGGVVPAAGDNVTIVTGDTVTVDTPRPACNNLTLNGVLRTLTMTATDTITVVGTVNGNVLINPTGAFVRGSSTTTSKKHYFTIKGNLTNNGVFDMRGGSPSVAIDLEFAGTTNSTITVGPMAADRSNNEFNGLTINKTGGAKVILGSDVMNNNNSSTNPAYYTFVNGMVDTGPYSLICIVTSSAAYVADSSKYAYPSIGRGFATGSVSVRVFDVGSAKAFRPFRARPTTALLSGHYLTVAVIEGNANTGSSVLTGGIDKVSSVRYYKLTFKGGVSSTTGGATSPSVTLAVLHPSYGAGEGIAFGNSNLRVAVSTDNRATWKALPQTRADTTKSLGNHVFWLADTLQGADQITLNDGQDAYVAFARVTGTRENSLDAGGVGVAGETAIPTQYLLGQNFPNPFNPSTTIEYGLPKEGHVALKVFDLLGRQVASVVDEHQSAGTYRVSFDASTLPSGVYLYQIRTRESVLSRRMMLVK